MAGGGDDSCSTGTAMPEVDADDQEEEPSADEQAKLDAYLLKSGGQRRGAAVGHEDTAAQAALAFHAVASFASTIEHRRGTIKNAAADERRKSSRNQRLKKKVGNAVAAAVHMGKLSSVSSESKKLQQARDAAAKLAVLQVVRRLDGFLKRSRTTLAELFTQIDTDGSGSVDVKEFRLGLRSVGLLFDDISIESLLTLVDTDGDGQLEKDEFCARIGAMIDEEATTPAAVLSRLCIYLRANRTTAQALFEELDTDGTGDLDSAELRTVLAHIGVDVSLEAAEKAMKALDVDGDGTLETQELAQAVEEFQRQRRVWAATVLGNLLDYVKKTKLSVQRIFARVDIDGSGNLDVLELQEAMLKMGQALSELEVELMMQELDIEGDTLVTSLFLDKLKQFESERVADTAKCEALFAKYDDDHSGTLDREEVALLAAEMGLESQVQDPAFLTKLIDDIESARRQQALEQEGEGDDQKEGEGEEEEESDGSVSYEEFLPWFLSAGRSYLPRPSYTSVATMDDLSEEALNDLFEKIDEDRSAL